MKLPSFAGTSGNLGKVSVTSNSKALNGLWRE